MKRRAFSLIELLVVLAVSAILFAIIAIPLVQGFNLTRAGQAFADAQERARALVDQIARDISNATSVRDLSGVSGQVRILVPSDPDRNGVIDAYVPLLLEGAKIDLLVPASGELPTTADPVLRNPDSLIDPNGDPDDRFNWRIDPTLRTPRGQVALPVTEGLRLVRYFVGLNRPLANDPTSPGNLTNARYTNPYDGILMRKSGDPDNLYVLRKAEVDLRVYDPATNSWSVNPMLDLNGDGELQNGELDDPDFFLLTNAELASNPLRLAKVQRIQQWLKRSRIVTEISRYDMIAPIVDRRTNQVLYDGVNPRIQALINFSPTRMSSEPVQGQVAIRSGEEAPNVGKVGPDTFTTSSGGWSSLFLRCWPSALRVQGTNNLDDPAAIWRPWDGTRPYLTGRTRIPTTGFSVFNFSGGNELTDGVEIFDASTYLEALEWRDNRPLPDPLWFYPFSVAVREANNRSGFLSNDAIREDFIAFYPNRRSGQVKASFAITEVGNASSFPPNGWDNRPYAFTGDAVHPDVDPTITGVGPANRWSGPAYSPSSRTSQINQRFNVLWRDWDLLAPGLEKAQHCHRFLDLRFLPNFDGEPSPLNPVTGFARARIVPGSEIIFGPDQIAGPNYGNLVRYTRAPLPDQVGPNQYYINYVNQPVPTNWTAIGLTPPADLTDPSQYDATNFVSAVLLARFRAGYVKFNSDPGRPLADGNISVFYRFQFTEPNDVFAVDYDSREKINVNLTIKNFPQTTLPTSQTVTVRSEATVRNFLR